MRVINYTEPIIIDNFLTHDECDYLINVEGCFGPSTIGNDKTHMVDKTVRNCDQKIFKDDIETSLLGNVCAQCEKYIPDYKIEIEPLSILRYRQNEYYRTHYDSSDFNKRHFTFVIMLSDDYEGGETEFPNLKREYKLKKGQALFFHNMDMNGNLTYYSYHGGKVVKSGEKWICNLWVTIEKPIVDHKPCHG
jgi:prolyl 4-hydroxylase